VNVFDSQMTLVRSAATAPGVEKNAGQGKILAGAQKCLPLV